MDNNNNLKSNINSEHALVTLDRWLEEEHTTSEKENIILQIDDSLRAFHSDNLKVLSFDPKDITEDLDDNIINFLDYEKNDNTDEYISSNLHDASILALGIYMDRDLRNNEDFVKSNFDEFTMFFPDGQTPYYRGTIQRNAPVYLNEFLEEKAKRELEKYKDSETKSMDGPFTGNNAAYIRNIVQPMILITLGFVIMIIALILRFV